MPVCFTRSKDNGIVSVFLSVGNEWEGQTEGCKVMQLRLAVAHAPAWYSTGRLRQLAIRLRHIPTAVGANR